MKNLDRVSEELNKLQVKYNFLVGLQDYWQLKIIRDELKNNLDTMDSILRDVESLMSVDDDV